MNKPQSILIFTEKITPRLQYVVDFVYAQQMQLNPKITSDFEVFQHSTAPKINYSNRNSDALQIIPQGLLYENEIKNIEWSDIQKDAWSAIFFLLSRYEEYLPYEPDFHGRFPATESCLFQQNLLKTPWVDTAIERLKNDLIKAYPTLEINSSTFQKIPTIDIDQAYLFKNKPIWRILGGAAKELFQFQFKEFAYRWAVLLENKNDPWDNLEPLLNEANSSAHTSTPIVFFLLGNYHKYDKNIHWKNASFQQLIRNVQKKATVGIHPSYQSHEKPELLAQEIQRLSEICSEKIQHSRQHYIKFNLPHAYQQLIAQGITDEYSMGYADHVGFRAGTSHAFYWYDLANEQKTSLKVHPFCAMDVTLKNYMKLEVDASISELEQLIKTLKNLGGTCRVIFHNESLSEYGPWENWKKLWDRFLE